jgi:oxaloacetate decarboxylase gamma subunit
MNENIELALLLLLVGMVTVFLVLILVYSLGNAIVRFVNRFFPEAEQAAVTNQSTGVDLKHKLAHIGRYRGHPDTIEGTLKHVGLDTGFLERLGPGPNGLVGVLTKQKIDLLEAAAIGLDTCKASHLNDVGSYFLKLIQTGYILTRRLPHIPVQQGEFYFSTHNII